MVFVFNKDGTRLMPTHPAKARILLKKKKAKIVKTFPFTIKLTYQIDNPKLQDIIISINSGKVIGNSKRQCKKRNIQSYEKNEYEKVELIQR